MLKTVSSVSSHLALMGDTMSGKQTALSLSLFDIVFPPQNPFADNSELQQRTARMLSLNTWDVAVALTNFDWTIFDSIHEVYPKS